MLIITTNPGRLYKRSLVFLCFGHSIHKLKYLRKTIVSTYKYETSVGTILRAFFGWHHFDNCATAAK